MPLTSRWPGLLVILSASIASAQTPDPLLAPVPPAPVLLETWEEAMALWTQNSADLQISAAEVARAAAARRVAIAGVLPELTGTALASFSLLPSSPGGDTATAALFGSAPFQTLSLVAALNVLDARTWATIAAANDAVTAARLSNDDARRLLLAHLAQALLSTVTSERLSELNRAGLQDALDRLRLGERANRAGASTEIDVGRLRQDAQQARLQVVAGDETLRQSREALALALGVKGAVGVSPGFSLDGLTTQLASSCKPIREVEQRSDVRAARARQHQAELGVIAEKAGFLPTVGLRSSAQTYHFGGETFPIWNLQAVLTVPLWDGGARYGRLRDAKAQRDQAGARLEAADRNSRVDVDRARRGVDVAEQSRELSRVAFDQARQTDALVRKAYDAGMGTSLELVTAASLLRQQQLALALRDYDVLRARVIALLALSDCS